METVTKKVLQDLRYISSHDVNMRLKDTIVSYKGEPVFCTGTWPTADGLSARMFYLESGSEFVCHSSDVDLDLTSLPLGWVGDPGSHPMFLARTTRTSQRQGIHLGSTLCLSIHGVQPGAGWEISSDLKKFYRMFKNEVFKISTVAQLRFGGPLNREWALVRGSSDTQTFIIFHRSIPVGTYFPERKEFFFRRGRLTKTRRMQLQELFDNHKNAGVRYAVAEQV